MSFEVFFDFSTGFACDLYFTSGTYDRMLRDINATERQLGIRREYYNGECRWNHWPLIDEGITDQQYCDAVEEHNAVVRWFYQECCNATKHDDLPCEFDLDSDQCPECQAGDGETY